MHRLARDAHYTWMLRPAAWFGTAYTLIIIIHETAHAVTAAALGIPSTLFNFWVNHDFSRATVDQRAVVFAAGPTFSLVVGLACWLAYRQVKSSGAGVPLTYLAALGIGNFFGNLISTAFVGDFSNAALVLGLTSGARYTVSLAGAAGLLAVSFWAGRELALWAPGGVGRTAAVIGLIALPAVVGMALVVVINQPTPMGASFITARAGEAAVWLVVGAVGAVSTIERRPAKAKRWSLRLLDGIVALAAVAAVRIMATGIRLGP